MTDLAVRPGTEPLSRLTELTERAQEYAEASRSDATRAAYATDWRLFSRWCSKTRLPTTIPVNPQVVVAYLADQAATLSAPTLARRLSAIKYQHHQIGEWSPTDHPQVVATLAGIRRRHIHRKKQARPLYLDDLSAAIGALDESPRGLRDAAVLLVGWWGAFRRSELVSLNTDDLEDNPQGIVVSLRRSKTDQDAQGRLVPLHYHPEPLCPVRALRSWLTVAGISGPVFRRVDRWGNIGDIRLDAPIVARIVKTAAESLGFDPTGFSAHSLRAGFVSECDRRGINSSAVRLVTGHKSDAMLAVYTRPRNLFESSAGAYF